MHPLITEELAAFDKEFALGNVELGDVNSQSVTVRLMIHRFLAASLTRVLSKLVAEVEAGVPEKFKMSRGRKVQDPDREVIGFNAGRQATLDALRSVIGEE